jgi:glycerol uptake facilitator-like aquaporin
MSRINWTAVVERVIASTVGTIVGGLIMWFLLHHLRHG